MEIGWGIFTRTLWHLFCMRLAVLAAQNRSTDCFEQSGPWSSRSVARWLLLWLRLIQAIIRHTCRRALTHACNITHNKSASTIFAHFVLNLVIWRKCSLRRELSRIWDSVQKEIPLIHLVSLALIQSYSLFIFTVGSFVVVFVRACWWKV